MENRIGGEADGGMDRRTEERKENEKRGENSNVKQNRVNVCLHTLWLFTPVFKVHTRTIREAGTITAIPSFLQT